MDPRVNAGVPGAAQHGAKRNDALQTRDRYTHRLRDGPGSAVHRFALHRIRDTDQNFSTQGRTSISQVHALRGWRMSWR